MDPKRIILCDKNDNLFVSFDIESGNWPEIIKFKGKTYYLVEEETDWGPSPSRRYFETEPFVVKGLSKKMDPMYY